MKGSAAARIGNDPTLKYVRQFTPVAQPDLNDCFADEVVAVRDIFCPWPDYGRPIKAEHVEKLRTKHGPFEMGKTRIAVALREDGRYACVDGNHTVEWARREGLEHVRARVYIDKTLKEEAQLFAAFDTQRRMNPVQSFMTRVAAGYETETRVLRIVLEAGYKISPRSDDGHISAVMTLVQIHDAYGPTTLADTLSLIRSAFGMERAGLKGEALSGLAAFWKRYATLVKRDDIINFLSLTGAQKMLHNAQMHRALNRSDDMMTAYGKQLRDIYNKRHHRKPLPEWKRLYSDDYLAKSSERVRKALQTRIERGDDLSESAKKGVQTKIAKGIDLSERARRAAATRKERGDDLSAAAKKGHETRKKKQQQMN